MANGVIQSRVYRQFRAEMKAIWQAQKRPCAMDGQPIDYDGPPNEPDSFELDHIKARKARPDLALDPSNAQPLHVRCNRMKGAGQMKPGMGETTEEW
nr:HNH endonuclease [Microbacterium bovistercoris]